MSKYKRKPSIEEKTEMLADLMGWELIESNQGGYWRDKNTGYRLTLIAYQFTPYSSNMEGLAQFAAILLRFSYVLERFTKEFPSGKWMLEKEPTQERILDEILKMNRVML